jgi:hypothetical protein
MDDPRLCDTDRIKAAIYGDGPISIDSTGLISVAPEPRYPKARVDMAEFMEVDAIFHMMLETVAKLRRAGASAYEVATYREEAINGNPWIETARWVTTGPKKGAK